MKILIVEDDKINVTLLKVLFRNINDISISVATDGQEAIDICHNENFDLIIMDIRLPKINGFDATKKIKENNNIVVVALTTHPLEFFQKEFKEAGFDYYIEKPINEKIKNQLINIINKIPSFS